MIPLPKPWLPRTPLTWPGSPRLSRTLSTDARDDRRRTGRGIAVSTYLIDAPDPFRCLLSFTHADDQGGHCDCPTQNGELSARIGPSPSTVQSTGSALPWDQPWFSSPSCRSIPRCRLSLTDFEKCSYDLLTIQSMFLDCETWPCQRPRQRDRQPDRRGTGSQSRSRG
jgi:hypothetical protein